MGILDFFKKKNEIVIKDIKDLPQEYKDMIYFLRPEYTLLTQESFINLYTSILIGDVLYISNMDNVNNYRSWLNKANVKNARMLDFAYDTDKGIVLKNRFGSYTTYPDAKNCKNYKIRKNAFFLSILFSFFNLIGQEGDTPLVSHFYSALMYILP